MIMMEKLIEEVTQLVEAEYGRAGARYGLTHHSDHEAYGVLLEEFQEAEEEVRLCGSALELLWKKIKRDSHDDRKMESLSLIQTKALLGACELIQVAAMAKKSAITICDRRAVDEFKGE